MRVLVLALVAVTGCARAVRPDKPATVDELVAIRTPSGRPPAFPPQCKRDGKVAFVAIEPLQTVDLEAVAERYRRVLGLEVEVLPAVAAAPEAFNAERQQHDAQKVISGAYTSLKVPASDSGRWIIGVTDADLFWSEREWRYCFSLRSGHGAVISTARTQPEEPLLSAARTFKLITRMLAETYCGLERGGPDDSVLRPTMMGLDDLDMLDESVWIPAPITM